MTDSKYPEWIEKRRDEVAKTQLAGALGEKMDPESLKFIDLKGTGFYKGFNAALDLVLETGMVDALEYYTKDIEPECDCHWGTLPEDCPHVAFDCGDTAKKALRIWENGPEKEGE